jgi:ABC-type sugar transport system permease subunit
LARQAHRVFRRPWDRWGLFFLLPGLVFFAAIFVYPTIRTISISFSDYNLLTPPKFTGLNNYATLFQQGIFLGSAQVTGLYVLVVGVLNYVLPFAIAVALMATRRGLGLGRAIYFLPVILPWVVVSTIWRVFYLAPGPISSLLGLVGIRYGVDPLTQPSTALAGLIIIALWKTFGFYVVLFLTGLYAIPDAYYEVAEMDGANAAQRFRYVTFPLMRSTSLFIATVNFIGAIKEFDPFQVITAGGPARATYATTLFIYETGFKFLRMGRAAAASLLLCAAIIAVTVIQFRIFRPARD